MLKVDVNSWHYRLRGQIFDYPPKDLCRYFWTTVAAAIAIFFISIGYAIYWILRPVGWLLAKIFRPLNKLGDYGDEIGTGFLILLAIVAAAALIALISWGVWALLYNTDDFLHGVLVVAAYAGLALLVLAGIILLALALAGIVHVVKKWHRNRPPKAKKPVKLAVAKPKKEKKVSEGDSTWTVAWTFLMSKKRRVCPLIQVVGASEGPAPGDEDIPYVA